MPLVIICGSRCTGKSSRAREIAAYLESQGQTTVVVSDEEEEERDRDSSEGDVAGRARLKSMVERELARPGVVVLCDAVNDIRGFRYELHCLARARATTCCTVHCAVPAALSDAWNAARRPQPLGADTLADSRRRFEPPAQTNRWERPLFVAADPAAPLPLAELCAALFSRSAPVPNRSTAEEAPASAASVHGLDAATREVVTRLLHAVADPAFIPGDTVAVRRGAAVVVPRRVGAAELGRLRRQFVRLNEGCATSLADPVEAFTRFLNSTL